MVAGPRWRGDGADAGPLHPVSVSPIHLITMPIMQAHADEVMAQTLAHAYDAAKALVQRNKAAMNE